MCGVWTAPGCFHPPWATDADYTFPRLGIKANIVGPVDCLATYQNPTASTSTTA